MVDKKTCERLWDVERVVSLLGKISLFGGLTDAQLYTLFQALKQVSYRAGEYIFEQGEEPTHIYVIVCGTVKIIVEEDGTSLELITFDEGQTLGETSVIGIQRHSASALVMEDAELIVLPRDALLALFETDPKLFGTLILNIAREACRRLHHADETLLHYFHRKT